MNKMDKKIRVLILVDCQNDFISGSLANEAAQKCIPNIVKKIKEFDGDAIFLTMDTHDEDYLDTPEGKKLPVKHCIKGTDGWDVDERVKSVVEERKKSGVDVRYIMKPTFASVIGLSYDWYTSLVDCILNLEAGRSHPIPMEIEICGFCTDICVLHNAITLKAFTYDFAEIAIDSECCAGTTPENHKKALDIAVLGQINVK